MYNQTDCESHGWCNDGMHTDEVLLFYMRPLTLPAATSSINTERNRMIKLQSACWTDISIRIRASDTEASAPLVPAATVPNRSANLCQVLDGTQFTTQKKKTWKGIFFEIFLSLLT